MLADKTILTVDDDPAVLGVVGTLFEREKATALSAMTLADMWAKLGTVDIDLILLDVMMPDGDGMDAMRKIRQMAEVPVIMLTGRDTPLDRVLGLEFGADDYIGKPFEPRELLARARSVLRRCDIGATTAEDPNSTAQIRFGDFTLDTDKRTLTHRVRGEIALTSTEYELLCCLAAAANRPLNRDQLMDGAFSREWSPFDRSIDVMIGRLRKKIEEDPAAPRHIKTVRGVGYVLSGVGQTEAAIAAGTGEGARSAG